MHVRTYLDNLFATLLAGKTPATAMPLFYADNYPTDTQVNSVNWLRLGGFDVSCIGNTPPDGYASVDLVTRQHCVTAEHHAQADGFGVEFLGNDNVVYTRTIDSHVTSGDIRVCLLSSALPAACTPMQVLPDDWANYIDANGAGLPCVRFNGRAVDAGLDHHKDASVSEVDAIALNDGISDYMLYERPNPTYPTWHKDVTGGDSGSKIVLPINGRLAWIGGPLSGMGADTFSPTASKTLLRSLIASVGNPGSLDLEEANLSGFSEVHPTLSISVGGQKLLIEAR